MWASASPHFCCRWKVIDKDVKVQMNKYVPSSWCFESQITRRPRMHHSRHKCGAVGVISVTWEPWDGPSGDALQVMGRREPRKIRCTRHEWPGH